MRNLIVIVTFLWCISSTIVSQNETSRHAYVDKKGVLRWSDDQSEIHGFGVNYTVPFAHAFRMARRLGISPEEAIHQDVYHFARLDLDLYRVHVWDTEISDSIGNLLKNEHLNLFDFAISEMKKRDMHFIITPIAFWGNGWPEPDEDTPGFSHKYGKEACLTNPDAIEAQINYLKQFLQHINPYTGIAYKDDPDIIAFEVSNEPHHNQSKEEVKAYINKLVNAMRSTGTQTPVFYNMSHSIHLAEAYFESDVQGGTFQWYPSGLVSGHALKGNYLPHVNNYKIPFASHPEFQNKAKIVYEFDPADVAGNYMYPAMARSFREAGMQTATQFAYDAMFLAPYNTNYGTHYMNLAYAPQKALSLKIASAVFHEIPRYANFGDYPRNNTFGNFRVDYKQDLAELVSEKRFFYTNNTGSKPSSAKKLKEIAGYGSSPVVKYEGKGAYFLDEVENGIWRLEVMPDAYWLQDPYATASPKQQVAAIQYNQHHMQINLPQLGPSFSVKPLNDGNHFHSDVRNGSFDIRPGVYLLRKNKTGRNIDPYHALGNIHLNEFVAPAPNLDTILIKNNTPRIFDTSDSLTISFEVISPELPEDIAVFVGTGWKQKRLEAKKKNLNCFYTTLPNDFSKRGRVLYFIALKTDKGWQTWPGNLTGKPDDWDFISGECYSLSVLPEDSPVLLWSAEDDWTQSMSTWNPGVNLIPAFDGESLQYSIKKAGKENSGNRPLHTFKFYFADKLEGRKKLVPEKNMLVIKGTNQSKHPVTLEISLIDASGSVRSFREIIPNGHDLIKKPLQDLQSGKFAIVPRPFPDFLPYYANITDNPEFNWDEIETLQVSIPGTDSEDFPINFSLDEIWIEQIN